MNSFKFPKFFSTSKDPKSFAKRPASFRRAAPQSAAIKSQQAVAVKAQKVKDQKDAFLTFSGYTPTRLTLKLGEPLSDMVNKGLEEIANKRTSVASSTALSTKSTAINFSRPTAYPRTISQPVIGMPTVYFVQSAAQRSTKIVTSSTESAPEHMAEFSKASTENSRWSNSTIAGANDLSALTGTSAQKIFLQNLVTGFKFYKDKVKRTIGDLGSHFYAGTFSLDDGEARKSYSSLGSHQYRDDSFKQSGQQASLVNFKDGLFGKSTAHPDSLHSQSSSTLASSSNVPATFTLDHALLFQRYYPSQTNVAATVSLGFDLSSYGGPWPFQKSHHDPRTLEALEKYKSALGIEKDDYNFI